MIRKFEKKDINDVMRIWENENIRTHKFISKDYWKNNYKYVKEILPNADIYVYVLDKHIVGLVGVNNNYIEGIFIDINNQHTGIGTSLLDKVKENKDSLTLSVYKKNINAINFYKKNDLEEVKEKLQFERTEFHSNGQPTTVLGANYTEPFSPRDVMKLVCKKIYKCYNNLDL